MTEILNDLQNDDDIDFLSYSDDSNELEYDAAAAAEDVSATNCTKV